MANISDQQLAFLDQFQQALTENIDWASAPQTLQDDYTTFQQIIQSLMGDASAGSSMADSSTGGPG